MKQDEFTAASPGELLQIIGGWAFLPAPAPRQVRITTAILNGVDDARGALGEFVGRASLVANSLLITEPLLTIEAVESNRIEGTHTLVSDVLRQEVAGPPKDDDEASRNQEVILYRRALRLGESWLLQGRPFGEFLIQALHAELLRTGRGRGASLGMYRNAQVLIGAQADTPATARFVPPPPEQLSGLMSDLGALLAEEPHLPAIITCAIAHYQFETIHPFEDGNGRIGRLLVPLYLTAQGVIPRPILYVSAYLEANRDEYYSRLKRVSTHGEWDEWIVFFLRSIEVQATDSKRRVERILSLRDRWLESVRAASRSQAALAAVDFIMSRMWVTIPGIAEYAQCSYAAAKNAISALEGLGILRRDPALYPATWYSPDLVAQIYG